MRTIGPFGFPDTPAECGEWVPYVRHVALSRRVLAVMQTRIEGAWAAYIDAVPGKRHGDETAAVLSDGVKLPEELARLLFRDVPPCLRYAP